MYLSYPDSIHVIVDFCSYEVAKTALSTTELLAPAYFILGGTKSGEVGLVTVIRKLNLFADLISEILSLDYLPSCHLI